ncbi:hypothetical protein CC86DRAFT_406388 [Ophiobolus disseminans]|uniref:Uncharacterized protein n=1 Tax=Ophiobolus disseminans TaxID=1469910 RepID=A0A6A6ZZK6_9PLEO|nr:hypothetical protein CC86DRAFT_406388 [Ophiobolus disseminans]
MDSNSTRIHPIMTELSPTTFFNDLPTEMKITIFTFVRTMADKRAVCLVSREWRRLMPPMLWDVFVPTFQPLPTGSLTALLQSGSNILPHIKRIHVRVIAPSGTEKVHDPSVEASLKFIIGALPKNVLQRFTSDMSFSTSFFMHLLQSQQQWQTFNLRWHPLHLKVPSEIVSAGQAVWLASSLGSLKQLTLYADPTCASNLDDCRFLIQSTDQLDALEIRGFKSKPSIEILCVQLFSGLEPVDGTPARILCPSRLTFCNLDLATKPTTMPYLRYENLVKLLHGCTELQELAITICPIYLGPIERVGSDFALDADSQLPQTELEALLDIIVRQSKLHTLRILALPTIDFHALQGPPGNVGREQLINIHVNAVQVAMQRFASQVMSYMAGRESKLKVLAMSPYLQLSSFPDKDENGHRWPNYHYTRSWDIDARGIEHVVALSLTHAALEMPESRLLYDN